MNEQQRRLITEHTYACMWLVYHYLMCNLDTDAKQDAEYQYAVACDTYLQRSEKKVWA